MNMTPDGGLPVPHELRRSAHRDREHWLASGRFAIDLICDILGRPDLDGVELLDVGCGTKVTKTLLDEGRPIGRYVGIDAASEVVDWLHQHVDDPRFEFHHLDAHNEMYNPTGTPLAEFVELPTGPRTFDMICLFSVFTHLAPHDAEAMLRLLRVHVKPEGFLLFSVYLEHPLARWKMTRALEEAVSSDDPEVANAARNAFERAMAGGSAAVMPRSEDPGYRDGRPGEPLSWAVYTREIVLDLVDRTGWEVVSVNPPRDRYIQDYLVCRPG